MINKKSEGDTKKILYRNKSIKLRAVFDIYKFLFHTNAVFVLIWASPILRKCRLLFSMLLVTYAENYRCPCILCQTAPPSDQWDPEIQKSQDHPFNKRRSTGNTIRWLLNQTEHLDSSNRVWRDSAITSLFERKKSAAALII